MPKVCSTCLTLGIFFDVQCHLGANGACWGIGGGGGGKNVQNVCTKHHLMNGEGMLNNGRVGLLLENAKKVQLKVRVRGNILGTLMFRYFIYKY